MPHARLIDTPAATILVLPSEDAADCYLDAVLDYGDTGDRPALMRSLLGLGIGRELIDWHVENRGTSMGFGVLSMSQPCCVEQPRAVANR